MASAKPTDRCWAIRIGAASVAGSCGSSAASAWGPPVDEAMAIRRSPRLSGRSPTAAGVEERLKCRPGLRHERGAVRLTPDMPNHGHPGEHPQPSRQSAAIVDPRLGGRLQRPARHRRHGIVRVGQIREHQDRRGPRRHDLFDGGQTVHHRHLQVQGDDIGLELERQLQRLTPVGRLAADAQSGLGLQQGADERPRRAAVVDHQDADRFHTSSWVF
jgi:hypothetical protein